MFQSLKPRVKPLHVVISKEAYIRICTYGERHASPRINLNEQKEVYGLLVGHVDRDTNIVYVTDAIPCVSGQRTSVAFEEDQYVDMAQIGEQLYEFNFKDSEGNELFFCGWFHTHPGFGFFYSATDKLTHLGYQNANPHAIGIIYDYTKRAPALDMSGLEVLRLKETKNGDIAQYSEEEQIPYSITQFTEISISLDTHITEALDSLEIKLEALYSIEEDLLKSDFKKIQKKYGLILEAKEETYHESQMDLENRLLNSWDYSALKKTYEIPKFRQKIESILEYGLKHEKKREEAQTKAEELLKPAEQEIQHIKKSLLEKKEEVMKVYNWLDTKERRILKNAERLINLYIKILNNLKVKAANIGGKAGWVDKIMRIPEEKYAILEKMPSLHDLKMKFLAGYEPMQTSEEKPEPLSEDELFEKKLFSNEEDKLFWDE